MNKKEATELLAAVKENSPKRKFNQSYDLIVALKGLDLKKPDQQVDFFTTMHYSRGKKVTVCGLVGPELEEESKKVCDETISVNDFEKYQKDKKLAKKLAQKYDFFVAQANIMAKVAGTFGRVFGPRGKMPNPKAGCVVPPKTNLQPLYDKLQKTIRVLAKTSLMSQVVVGSEGMKDEEVIDNVLTVYDQVIHHLPNEKNNIKSVFLKTTMGKPVKLGAEAVEEPKEESKKKAKAESKKEVKADVKEEVKPEAKEESKPEVKEEAKEEPVDTKEDANEKVE